MAILSEYGTSWWGGLTLAQAKDPAAALVGGPEVTAATGTAQPLNTGPAPATSSTPGLGVFLLPVAVLVIFTLLMGGTQRKEKKRQAALMASLRKQDKVLTIGGLIGTVVDIRDDEIVLKIDENSNTRVRFTRSAIQQVLKPGEASASGTPANAIEPKVEVRAGKAERATA